MSQICESCGAPEARLFPFYPATLCPECVARRVAERKAAQAPKEAEQQRESAESLPDPGAEASTPDETQDQRLAREARSRKKIRKNERKGPARASLKVMRKTLPAQAALVRVHLHAGNDRAAHTMARSLLQAFLTTGYSSLTGAVHSDFPADRMAARLRSADLIDSAAMTAIISALSLNPDSPTSAGIMLRAIEIVAFGAESESDVARRSRRKRILNEGERLAQSCGIQPAIEVAGVAKLALAGIVAEAEIVEVLGVDWTTWERDYRMRIPGITTEKGRFYLRSTLRDWFAERSKSISEHGEVKAAK